MSPSVGSTGCCMSRDPPSPDGLAPREALTSKLDKRKSKEQTPSLTLQQESELRAIFEEDVEYEADKLDTPRPKGTAKLKPLLIGEKSDSEDSFGLHRRASTSTLKAVSQKLKKRFSRDSATNKRHSRTSVGTSEEEIERRAELRRIRQKRILEELSNENFDDDADSLASVANASISLDKTRKSSWVSGTPVPLPCLTPPALPYPTLNLPVLTPFEKELLARRPTTEGDAIMTPSPMPRTNPMEETVTSVNTSTTISRSISRRHSSPALPRPDVDESQPIFYIPRRRGSSIPPVPRGPVLEPKRLASITEPVPSSWRLSFSAEKRGEELRKLSQPLCPPVIIKSEVLGPSPASLGKWLHSQGLRSTSQVINSEDNEKLEVVPYNSLACSAGQDFGGVDGVGDPGDLHLHEMGISMRLASSRLQSSSSSPQLSSWGSHQREFSSLSGNPQPLRTETRDQYQSSDSATLSQRIPTSWGIVRESSSIYPSHENSALPSPDSSRFNLVNVLTGTRTKTPLAQTLEPPTHELSSLSKMIPVNMSASNLDSPLECSRHPTRDDSSAAVSETNSFHQREAELRFIPKRFASSESRRMPSTPRSSKFREEFGHNPETPARKSSVFRRLSKFAHKNFDGPTDKNIEELLNIPVPDFKPEALLTISGSHRVSPFTDDDAENAWVQVLKHKANADASNVAGHLQIPKKGGIPRRKKSNKSDELKKRAGLSTFSSFLGKKKKSVSKNMTASEEYQQRFQGRLEVKELVMDSWEAEMEATAARAKSKSRNIVKKIKKPTEPDYRYPATWSRFPSHTRSVRSSANRPDRVGVKDFAKLGMENGEIIWCLEHDDNGHHATIDHESRRRNPHQRLGDKIAKEIYEFNTADEQSVQTSGRRGSLTIAGELEYPELEVLPVTFRTEKELADEVHEEFKQDVADGKRAEMPKLVGNKTTPDEKAGTRPHIPRLGVRKKIVDMDGSIDAVTADIYLDHEMDISIADPSFYDDCVVDPAKEAIDAWEAFGGVKGQDKHKYNTWSGRDWAGYNYGHLRTGNAVARRPASVEGVIMWKSTDDHFSELVKAEKEEKERILKAVEEAWGERRPGRVDI